MKTLSSLKSNWHIIATLGLFAVLFILLSIVNHLCFRTSGLDLGIYTQALYNYAHFHFNDSSLFLWNPQNLLSDHFDLYLIIFSPLVWLFGQYTLLIVQIASVLFGAWGIHQLIHTYTPSRQLPYVAMLCFLCFFGIWHALSYDYHSNVVATMLLPWLLLCFRQRRYGWSMVLVVLMSIAKETMPLWLFFVALALLWDYRRDRRALMWIGIWMGYSVLYFVIIAMVVMPSLGSNSQVIWRYAYMGHNFHEMAIYILSHPLQTVANIFTNFTRDADYNGIKLEFYLCCLTSGLLLTFFKPNYLLMLIPLLAQKMLARDSGFWGINIQYNIEFAPILVVASFIVLASVPKKQYQKWGILTTLILTIGTTFYTVDTPITHIRCDNLRLYQKKHYQQHDFDVAYARKLIKQIPSSASVCATTVFVPHLALRDSAYIFPIGLGYNAQYVLVKKHYWCYSEGDEEEIGNIIADTSHWQTLCTNEDLYLLKRK